MDNVLSLVLWAKNFARNDKHKKHHKHCVVIKTYDNLYQRQIKTGETYQKISG